MLNHRKANLNDILFTELQLPRDALAGRVAVVTGAGRGIGREAARALAALGARVVIAELAETGRETEASIRAAGGKALFVQTDVADPRSVEELARRTESAFGPADILVNNAILCPVASVLEMDVELWDRVMGVNLRGTFLTCKALLPGMLAQGGGVIVNMVSTDAMPHLSAYIASKQGIAAFSQSLAGEVGERGVRVIAFAPGFVDTPGLRAAARGLAPAFGLSEEAFMRLPMHPAYPDEAMPAVHAGAAAAYLVARLADEYHGEQVTGYTVLERAGFLQHAGPAGDRHAIGAAAPAPDRKDAEQQALDRVRALVDVLAETEAEFESLPVFVRPLARSGFKRKSGHSLNDWRHTLTRLEAQFRSLQQGDENARLAFAAQAVRLREALDKLAVYYREVPAETGRFIREADLLREIEALSERRVRLIRDLQADLDRLAQASST